MSLQKFVLAAVVFAAAPAAADLVFLDSRGGPIITTGDVNPVYNGTDNPWDLGVFTDLFVGETETGTLTIQDGGEVYSGRSSIGDLAGATGTVTVSGESALLDCGILLVGDAGAGTLVVDAGGTVDSGSAIIGNLPGSTGSVLVAGSGSLWNSTGSQRLGSPGTATLDILDGGIVSNQWGARIGGSSTPTTVTVAGAGSLWSIGRDLNVDSGTLAIEDGGAVETTGDTSVGYAVGVGRVQLNGGTLSTAGLLTSFNDLGGTGTINTNTIVGDVELIFDATLGLQQTMVLNDLPGQNVTLNIDASDPLNAGSLGAGYLNSGTLTVTDGEQVSSGAGYLGYHGGAIGTATINGADSQWNMSGILFVGFLGSGTLHIEDGGSVQSSHAWVGVANASTVTINGAASQWSVNYGLRFGDVGTGTCQQNDGNVWVGIVDGDLVLATMTAMVRITSTAAR